METAWDVLDAQWRSEVALDWSPSNGPTVLALDSEKGGVGKTGLAGGLIAVGAAAGMRVIAVDLDPRATLTEELDATGTGQYTVNDLLYVDPSADVRDLPTLRGLAEQALRPAGPSWPGSVQVLAAERALAHRESDVTANLENRLKVSLQGVADHVDLVVVDLPPRAGGKLVGSGLLAATHGLLPATLDEDGYIGARDALRTIEIATGSDPAPLNSVGVVRNIVDRRTTLAKTYDDKLREEYGTNLLDVVIPKRVLRQEARTACVPITTASGAEARALCNAYTLVLNHIAEVA